MLTLNGITIGIGLLCLSQLWLHQGHYPHTRVVTAVILCLTWLASGQFLLSQPFSKQPFVASIPLVFFVLIEALFAYHRTQTQPKPDIQSQSRWSFRQFLRYFPLFMAALLSASVAVMPKVEFNRVFFAESATLSTWGTANALGFAALTVLWLLMSLSYLFTMVRHTHKYHHSLAQHFSNYTGRRLQWFLILMGWLAFTWLYSVVVLATDNQFAHYGLSESGVPIMLMGTCWLFASQVLQQKNHPLAPSSAPDPAIARPQYEKSALDSERQARIATQIEQQVRQSRLFLDPELDAAFLARTLGVPAHYLSQTFSQHMATTFYDYVNTARIEFAMQCLSDSKDTVLDIALKAGFNTRSAFYNAFKKHTGTTPSAFRQSSQK